MVTYLDLYADLAVTCNGEEFSLQAEQQRLLLTFPTWRAATRFLVRLLRHPQGAKLLRSLDTKLCNLYLTLDVKAGRLRFAFLGMKANADLLTILLGVFGRRTR
ncbi:MAG: hypothetical protein ACUVRZ_06740 [Desulfobacca sp.]|uniref:hypothetical protein n=1 Tax=Desulfobacca sp. TaxID=2067990 RepID=UPI004049583D